MVFVWFKQQAQATVSLPITRLLLNRKRLVLAHLGSKWGKATNLSPSKFRGEREMKSNVSHTLRLSHTLLLVNSLEPDWALG